MVAETKPDVVSVCTPAAGRADLVTRLLEAHRPRLIVCEKPLETSAAGRQRIVEACARTDVRLVVNYTRRYEHVYRAAVRKPLLHPDDPHIVAIASDQPVPAGVPVVALDNVEAIADIMLRHAALIAPTGNR